MHILIGIAVLVGLVAFAFGEVTARIFVGFVLACGALVILGLVGIAVVDQSRQTVHKQPAAEVDAAVAHFTNWCLGNVECRRNGVQ